MTDYKVETSQMHVKINGIDDILIITIGRLEQNRWLYLCDLIRSSALPVEGFSYDKNSGNYSTVRPYADINTVMGLFLSHYHDSTIAYDGWEVYTGKELIRVVTDKFIESDASTLLQLYSYDVNTIDKNACYLVKNDLSEFKVLDYDAI